MVDLWGPGAFGAADAVTSRPAYDPTNGALDPDTFYKDCSSPAEDDGTEWKSAALNMLLAQMRQVVRRNSVPASNLDDDLLLKAIVSGAVSYAVATGTANAWTVSPSLAVPAYAAGRVLNIIAPATNTSTTVNMNVSTLGNRRIKKRDGSDPAVGDLVSGTIYATIDDGTNIRVLEFLPSDLAAQKSPFNIQQNSFATRASLSGTGFVTYQTGSYTKKSATSSLIVSISTNSFATSNAPGILRCTFGANSVQAVISSNDNAQSRPAANARKVFTSISAGALSWTLALGRNDGVSWSNVTNPNNTDVGFLPTETTTSVTFEELEP